MLQLSAVCSDCATAKCPIRAECESLSVVQPSPFVSDQDLLIARLGYFKRRCRSLETQLNSLTTAYWTKIAEAG